MLVLILGLLICFGHEVSSQVSTIVLRDVRPSISTTTPGFSVPADLPSKEAPPSFITVGNPINLSRPVSTSIPTPWPATSSVETSSMSDGPNSASPEASSHSTILVGLTTAVSGSVTSEPSAQSSQVHASPGSSSELSVSQPIGSATATGVDGFSSITTTPTQMSQATPESPTISQQGPPQPSSSTDSTSIASAPSDDTISGGTSRDQAGAANEDQPGSSLSGPTWHATGPHYPFKS